MEYKTEFKELLKAEVCPRARSWRSLLPRTRLVIMGMTVLTVLFVWIVGTAHADYVGSDTCMQCHEGKYNDFRASGHPYKLRTVAEAKANPIPLPSGVTWNDLSYVVGGYKWKIRYVDKNGYVITSPGGVAGKNQYNVGTGRWVDYEAGKQKKYDCGACHTTGYSPDGNQDGMPGIVGSWVFPGIQCEACHGEGSNHAAAPSTTNIQRNLMFPASGCGTCHTKGDIIQAGGQFLKHGQQYPEFLKSPHAVLNSCVTCHDPHKKAEFSIVTTCTDCHTQYADTKAAFTAYGRMMTDIGITCVDCHMPYVVKSADAVNDFMADVRSHLFRINTAKGAAFLTPDGTEANGYLTPDIVCLGCHIDKTKNMGVEKAKVWAQSTAQKIHKKVRR